MNVLLPPDVLDRMLVERTGQRDEVRRRADTLARALAERTAERDLARDAAAALEAELASLTVHPDGVLLRPWTDPAPRVLEDSGVRCACGSPVLPDVSHSQDRCIGREAGDE